MDLFLKIIAVVLITIVLGLILSKQSKDYFVLLSITGCCLVMLGTISFLRPVIEFMDKLAVIGQFDSELLNALLKAVGIAIIAELSCLICNDAGNSSLGKTVHLLAGAVILWLSIPFFSQLLELLEDILGSL